MSSQSGSALIWMLTVWLLGLAMLPFALTQASALTAATRAQTAAEAAAAAAASLVPSTEPGSVPDFGQAARAAARTSSRSGAELLSFTVHRLRPDAWSITLEVGVVRAAGRPPLIARAGAGLTVRATERGWEVRVAGAH